MSNNDLILQRAYQHHQNKEFKEAENLYRSILEKGVDDDIPIYQALSDALNQQGKSTAAKALLQSAIELQPTQPLLKLGLAQQCMAMQEFAEASAVSEALISDFPDFGEAYYIKGNLCMQQQDLEGAMQAFEKTISLLPTMAEAHYNLGVLRYQKGDSIKAEENWKQAVAAQPSLLPAWLNLGNLALESNQFQEAINYLNSVLAFDPDHFSAIKMIGMAQHALGDVDDALQSYLKIDNEQNPSEEVLTLIANAYRDLGRITKAEEYYLSVLKMNPENSIAKENIQKMDQRKIEGWHFKMLADLGRNDGYDRAIKRNVKAGNTVLDIGTGSGLLSMMGIRAGAKKVYTCETVEVIANVAKQVIADNNFSDQIEVFNLKSSSLKLGEEIPKKVDVLVSEILDAGLLGEGVIPSVRHAKTNFLKEGGVILPAGATVKAMLIESKHLEAISPLGDISGFDLSSFGKFQYQNNYETIILNNNPHKKISEEKVVWNLDLYQLPEPTSALNPNIIPIEIEVQWDGEINAIVYWFDLHFDKEESLSSGSDGEMIHWGQAAYGLPGKRKVKKGDLIKLKIEQSDTNLIFRYAD